MSARRYFGETEVVKEIRKRPHMACLLAYTSLMPSPDLFKFEFGIKGLFRADFVVGNHKSRKFVLVEFEDGTEDSLFKAEPLNIGIGRIASSTDSGRLSIGLGPSIAIRRMPYS